MQEFNIIKKFFRPLTKQQSKTTKIASTKPQGKKNNKQKSTEINLKNPQKTINFTALNLEDDVGIINYNKSLDLIVSKDIFVENVHFLKSDGAYKIASKLLLTNISDIASSGGKPIFYLLGYSKNSTNDDKFFREFTQALHDLQKKYQIFLIGGDTSSSKDLFYSITIFGEVKKNHALLRCNAENGDLIFVSNTIGDAFLGLNIKLNNVQKLKNYEKILLQKHYYPEPRIDLAQKLSQRKISKCATDISDGLIADLSNICNTSQLDAKIFLNQIPISSASLDYLKANKKFTKIDLITGGDDYELIFTIKPQDLNKILRLEKELNLKLTCIGKFFNSKSSLQNKTKFNVNIFNSAEEQEKPIIITKKGYEH